MKLGEIKNTVGTLTGVGPAKAALFAKLNVFTVGDLLRLYPRDFEDRTKRVSLAEFQLGSKVHTIAQVTGHDWFGYGRMKTLKILITDGTAPAELVAFNRPFLENALPVGSIIAVTGSFEIKFGKLQSTSFETEKIAQEGDLAFYANAPVPDSRVIPIYPLTEGLSQKIVHKAVMTALAQYGHGIEDEISEQIRQKRNLLPKAKALAQIHNPATLREAIEARNTLVYEELYLFQMTVAERAYEHRGSLPAIDLNASISSDSTSQPKQPSSSSQPAQLQQSSFESSLSPRQKQLLARLPFTLTKDQQEVIMVMNRDIDRNYGMDKTVSHFSMRALLQGDVGSGKTLVAFFACLRVIDYGSQCALMAPTELLARQHAENAARMLEALTVRVAFLTGNINASGRTPLLAALKAGEVDIVIGTHALFSRAVQYKDLALAVIDEQHRFGVLQRAAILDKGRKSIDSAGQKTSDASEREPNLLMMSATPIPQTLALTVYGDLDVLTIHTMPQGRKPVTTYLVRAGHEQNAYEAVRKEFAAGHQAYFVYPAIEKNENAYSDDDGSSPQKIALKSAEDMYQFLTTRVYPGIPAALIHSKIDEDEQNVILNNFRKGKIKFIVATTVVEVGVDVPNATCMVIEQADRFGLAELHQLRGRVGRGSDQSYCFLIYSDKITETGIARMKALHETTDGFKIAEEDLKLRGPGEITGTAQSGELTFALADPVRDQSVMQQARADAFSELSKTISSRS